MVRDFHSSMSSHIRRRISREESNPNTLNNGTSFPPSAQKEQQDKNKEITEKILMEDEGFKMRATVRQEPKKDKYGNFLDSEGNINKSRGKVGIVSNENVNPNTGQPMTVEDLKAKQEAEKQEEQKNIRLRNEQQKMLRYEMQGQLDQYQPPEEFANHPLLQHPNKTNSILMANKQPAEAVQVTDTNQQGNQVVQTTTTGVATPDPAKGEVAVNTNNQQVQPASKVTDNKTNQQQGQQQ